MNFAMATTIEDLRMNQEYEFRVAAANQRDSGAFTPWKNVKTSTSEFQRHIFAIHPLLASILCFYFLTGNLIYVIHLNLTKVVYNEYLHDASHVRTVETLKNLRNLVSHITVRYKDSQQAN